MVCGNRWWNMLFYPIVQLTLKFCNQFRLCLSQIICFKRILIDIVEFTLFVVKDQQLVLPAIQTPVYAFVAAIKFGNNRTDIGRRIWYRDVALIENKWKY